MTFLPTQQCGESLHSQFVHIRQLHAAKTLRLWRSNKSFHIQARVKATLAWQMLSLSPSSSCRNRLLLASSEKPILFCARRTWCVVMPAQNGGSHSLEKGYIKACWKLGQDGRLILRRYHLKHCEPRRCRCTYGYGLDGSLFHPMAWKDRRRKFLVA